MGFDIMMIAVIVGTICIYLSVEKSFSKLNNNLVFVMGIILNALAFFLAVG